MGLRGSGKTTAGAIAATRLGRTFVDLDDLTAAELGRATPAAAFTELGEAAFRQGEERALRRALADGNTRAMHGQGVVLALGGGTPTHGPSCAMLEAARASGEAVVVYLHATPAALRERLARTDTSSRPALLGASTLGEIDEIYARRDGLYRSIAGAVIDAGSRSAEAVAAEVAAVMTARPS